MFLVPVVSMAQNEGGGVIVSPQFDDAIDELESVKAQLAAAEKVCEAAASLWQPKPNGAIGWGRLADALTEWRRTKGG